jgi:hypothetical protein
VDVGGRKWQVAGEDCIMRSFIRCKFHQILLRVIKTRRTRWAGHVARMRRMKNTFLVGNPEGKTSLGRTRRRLEDNIKTDFSEKG